MQENLYIRYRPIIALFGAFDTATGINPVYAARKDKNSSTVYSLRMVSRYFQWPSILSDLFDRIDHVVWENGRLYRLDVKWQNDIGLTAKWCWLFIAINEESARMEIERFGLDLSRFVFETCVLAVWTNHIITDCQQLHLYLSLSFSPHSFGSTFWAEKRAREMLFLSQIFSVLSRDSFDLLVDGANTLRMLRNFPTGHSLASRIIKLTWFT